MHFSTLMVPAFAASALSCFLESPPTGVDHFLRHRSTKRDGVQLYTLEFADGSVRQVTDEERWDLKRAHIRFFDVSDNPEPVSFVRITDGSTIAAFPSQLDQGEAVNTLIGEYSVENVRTTLTEFSGFFNRYYRADTGVESAQWLFDQVSALVEGTSATVQKFEHSFQQFSVIATIPGATEKTVVVGAHQDSINGMNPTGEAAGADDDGSGSMAILEALRTVLTDSRIAAGEADNTLEFHWYAGEEAGLLGSQDIFQDYAASGKDVAAMLNQDMVGYSPDNTFGLITDNTNAGLNDFTKLLIEEYAAIGYVESQCGYACSDHASATRAGYPSSFLFESSFDSSNPDIHTTNDVIDNISFEHINEHAKVLLGFLVELAFAPEI